MKKTIIMLLMLVIGISMLVGCGGSTTPTLSGKYYFVSMTADGETVTVEDMTAFGVNPDDLYLEFQAGGNFRIVLSGISVTQTGTFTVDGKTVTLTVEGDSLIGTIDGNRVTLENDGETMVFEKK